MDQETVDVVKQALAKDSIAEFETIIGKSWKKIDSEDERIAMVAFHADHSKKLQQLLELAGDTTFSESVESYVRKIEAFGFTKIFEQAFIRKQFDGMKDNLFAYWHTAGLLLIFNTYRQKTVNGGKVYYNWLQPEDNGFKNTSSGSYSRIIGTDEYVWVGDHDCREGLIANMTAMMRTGSFCATWYVQPSLYSLIHHHEWPEHSCLWDDSKNSIKSIIAHRISQFPQHVQDAIRGTQGKEF